MNFPVLTLLTLLPAVGAVAVVLAGTRRAKQVALVAAVATAVVAAVVALRFTPGGGQQFAEQVTWIRPLGAYYALGVDGIGLTLVLLVVIVTPVVIVASWRDFDKVRSGLSGGVREGRPPLDSSPGELAPKYDSRVF